MLYGAGRGTNPDYNSTFGTLDQANADYTLLGDPAAAGPLPAIAMNFAGEMFGAANTSAGSSSSGILIRIDPQTGALTSTIGPITDSADEGALRLTDLDFQPGTDVLFGFSAKGPKEGTLYVASVDGEFARIDPSTGAVIGPTTDLAEGMARPTRHAGRRCPDSYPRARAPRRRG